MSDTKEEAELYRVVQLCEAMSLSAAEMIALGNDDPPDVSFRLGDELVGVECTAYQATDDKNEINKGYKHNSARSAFYDCLDSQLPIQEFGYDIHYLSLLGAAAQPVVVPPRNEQNDLVRQIIDFCKAEIKKRKYPSSILINRAEIDRSGFPLVARYVNNIALKNRSAIFRSHSETSFHVAFDEKMLLKIIDGKNKAIEAKRTKAADKIEQYDDLWLLIHDGKFEQLLPSAIQLRGYVPSDEAAEALKASVFGKVVVSTLHSVYLIRIGDKPEEFSLS